MLSLSLRFLDINKLEVPLIIMSIVSIFTYLSISITILSFSNVCAHISQASHQTLRGDAIKCENEGESVMVSLLSGDPCITCKCLNQEIVCQREICPNFKGQCKLTDNITHYKTFDGKRFRFNGNCNYILARDCKGKAFSIHLVNKYQNETLNMELKNSSSFAGTSVMIKIDDRKVRLGANGMVIVGRKRVRLPYIRLGTFSISREAHRLVLRANIGIKVIWDAFNSIEIIVPPEFKSRTCGLCGNYNNNSDDDFRTKRGLIVTNIDKFTHSWKVGRNLACEDPIESGKALRKQNKSKFKNKNILKNYENKNNNKLFKLRNRKKLVQIQNRLHLRRNNTIHLLH